MMESPYFHYQVQQGNMEHVPNEELGIGTSLDQDVCLYQCFFRFSFSLRDHHYIHMALTIKVQPMTEILIASCFKRHQPQTHQQGMRKFIFGNSVCCGFNQTNFHKRCFYFVKFR